MNFLIPILAFTVLTGIGWALVLWVRADSFHPRAPRPEWFD